MAEMETTQSSLSQNNGMLRKPSIAVAETLSKELKDDGSESPLSVKRPENLDLNASMAATVMRVMSENPLGDLATPQKKNGNRRIIAEDPEWNLAAIERLTTLCLNMIVKNFEKNPVLDGIPEKYRAQIISSVSIDLPLNIASKLIRDESYWQRRAVAKYNLCSITDHNNSWKQLFFELHVRDLIENYVPKTGDDEETVEKIMNDLKTAAEYVEKLHIRQLHPTEPPELNPHVSNLDPLAVRDPPKELIIKPTDPLPNHFNVNNLFNYLHKLKDLSLFYGVKDCGINFNWVYFGMTLSDCQRISDSLKNNPTLVNLSIVSSGIDDDKCRVLTSALNQNMVLKNLNLSYNNIGDIGAHALAKVLKSPTTSLTALNLSNNKIGKEGCLSLSRSIGVNETLKFLDLRLNYIGDEAFQALCFQTCRNQVLESLNVSGNGIGSSSIPAVCILLRKNLRNFQSLDISCNRLGSSGSLGFGLLGTLNLEEPVQGHVGSGDGDAAGKAFFDAVSRNKYIIRFDLRMTDLSDEYLLAIQGILKENSAI